jgi:integrase
VASHVEKRVASSCRGTSKHSNAQRFQRQGAELALERKPIADITTADVEAVRAAWPIKKTAPRGGVEGPKRALRRLRHLFNWAIEKGIVDFSPFLRAGKVVVHIPRGAERDRRLEPGEDEKLFTQAAATDPWLYALLVVLIETGCRVGEILQLTWSDVKWSRNLLLVREETAKDAEPRDVPITSPVKAVLEMRKTDADGQEWPKAAFVFGNAIGERLQDYRRPWERLCAALEIEDLHIHDLRREFACRLRESGAPDHEVAAWLGHANISTTSVYLKTNRLSLQKAAKRFEQKRKLCKAIVNTLAEHARHAADAGSRNPDKVLN